MTLRTSIITASALFALALPAGAGAASTRADTSFRVAKETVSFHGSGQSRSAHESHAGKTSNASKISTGKSSKSTAYPVTYIFVPNPLVASSPVADPNPCQDSGSNCTDLQACAFWGMNCSGVGTPDQADVASGDAPTVDTPTAPASIPVDASVTTPSTTTTDPGQSDCFDYTFYELTGELSYC